ncbi:MAG: LuxR C-terminal-related transcriptional regulator, partial [Actinomycetota bacterium]
DAVLEHAGEGSAERAEALCSLSMVAYRAGDMAGCLRFADEAIEIARRVDDDRCLAHALHMKGWACEWGIADHEAAWAAFGEAASLMRERTDAWRPLNLGMWGWSYADSSEGARARPVLEEGLALTERTKAPHARCYCLVALGFLETLEGRFEEADAHLDEALALATEVSDHYAEICARLFRGMADLRRGRSEDARELCEDGLRIALKHRSPNCEGFMRHVLGHAHLVNGQLEDADREFDAAYTSVGVNMPIFAAMHPAARAVTALARGDIEGARRFADEALTLGRRTDTPLATISATAVNAAVALSGGDAHRSEDLVHQSLDMAMHTGQRPDVCDLLDALAAAIAHQGRAEEAARLLGAAQHAREAMGSMRPPLLAASHETFVDQVRDALGGEAFGTALNAGAKLSLHEAVAYAQRGRGRRKRPSHGWGSLTPMELQVVELVADGLTNPQIGEKLLISKRTVQSHLANVFAKLGVSSRAELAVQVAIRRAGTIPGTL